MEGDTVQGLTSGWTGVVVKRYLDLGQIIIKLDDENGAFNPSELLRANNNISDQIQLTGAVVQYNSVHHYEDTDGNWVDINPYNPSTTGLIPITYLNRLRDLNNKLREIKVFTPETVVQIQSEFNKLLLRG